MSHTKERWVLNENNNWKTNPFSITARKRGVHSATIANIPTRMTIPPLEQQANARLISAAPDLLDALLKLPQHHGATEQEWWDWIAIARAAIDKATNQGESK
jgi:hypothetical protein